MRILALLLALASLAWPQAPRPISYSQITRALKAIRSDSARSDPAEALRLIAERVRRSGVDFELFSEMQSELLSAGASAELIAAIRNSYIPPPAPAPAAAPAAPARAEITRAEILRESLASGDAAKALATIEAMLREGEEATLPVLTAPPGENFQSPCKAALTIAAAHVRIAAPACAPTWEAGRGAFRYLGKNREFGQRAGAVRLLREPGPPVSIAFDNPAAETAAIALLERAAAPKP
jgi:hypothetical protein